MFGKKKYEKKILVRALKQKVFLITHLRQQWDALENEAKKERLLRLVKGGGTTAAIVTGKALLTLLFLGGALTVAAVAPNIFGAIGRMRKRKAYFHKKQLREETAYLRRNNYIRVQEKNDENEERTLEIALTELGTQRAVMRALGELKIPKPERWDGIWRMVIFDIPDRHKWARDGLRHRLKTLGFWRLQESVFVFPYPCDEELQFLCSLYNIGDYMRIIETPTIIHDRDLKEYFGLR